MASLWRPRRNLHQVKTRLRQKNLKEIIISAHKDRAICLMWSALLGFRMLQIWNISKDSWILPSCLRMTP